MSAVHCGHCTSPFHRTHFLPCCFLAKWCTLSNQSPHLLPPILKYFPHIYIFSFFYRTEEDNLLCSLKFMYVFGCLFTLSFPSTHLMVLFFPVICQLPLPVCHRWDGHVNVFTRAQRICNVIVFIFFSFAAFKLMPNKSDFAYISQVQPATY